MTAAAMVLALAMLSGCFGSGERAPARFDVRDSGLPAASAGDDPFWLLWVQGREERRLVSGGVAERHAICSIVFDHQVGVGETRLTYAQQRHPIDRDAVQAIVAFDVFDQGDCPVAYTLIDRLPATVRAGRYGNMTVELDLASGAATVDGRPVTPGQTLDVRYDGGTVRDGLNTYRIDGRLNVTHLGAWPRTALVAGGP